MIHSSSLAESIVMRSLLTIVSVQRKSDYSVEEEAEGGGGEEEEEEYVI